MTHSGSDDVAWLLTDWRQSVRDVLDESGVFTRHLRFSPFGELNDDGGGGGAATETNPLPRHGWSGLEHDGLAGLTYMNARWYDPATGRFVSQDPLGFDAGYDNLYTYAGNDAIGKADPTGEFWTALFFGLGAIFGGLAAGFQIAAHNSDRFAGFLADSGDWLGDATGLDSFTLPLGFGSISWGEGHFGIGGAVSFGESGLGVGYQMSVTEHEFGFSVNGGPSLTVGSELNGTPFSVYHSYGLNFGDAGTSFNFSTGIGFTKPLADFGVSAIGFRPSIGVGFDTRGGAFANANAGVGVGTAKYGFLTGPYQPGVVWREGTGVGYEAVINPLSVITDAWQNAVAKEQKGSVSQQDEESEKRDQSVDNAAEEAAGMIAGRNRGGGSRPAGAASPNGRSYGTLPDWGSMGPEFESLARREFLRTLRNQNRHPADREPTTVTIAESSNWSAEETSFSDGFSSMTELQDALGNRYFDLNNYPVVDFTPHGGEGSRYFYIAGNAYEANFLPVDFTGPGRTATFGYWGWDGMPWEQLNNLDAKTAAWGSMQGFGSDQVVPKLFATDSAAGTSSWAIPGEYNPSVSAQMADYHTALDWKPSTAETFVPVLGSVKSMMFNYYRGNYVASVMDGGFLGLDVLPVAGVAKNLVTRPARQLYIYSSSNFVDDTLGFTSRAWATSKPPGAWTTNTGIFAKAKRSAITGHTKPVDNILEVSGNLAPTMRRPLALGPINGIKALAGQYMSSNLGNYIRSTGEFVAEQSHLMYNVVGYPATLALDTAYWGFRGWSLDATNEGG